MDLTELLSCLPESERSTYQSEFRHLQAKLPEIAGKSPDELSSSSFGMHWTYAEDADRIALLTATLLLLETETAGSLLVRAGLLAVLQFLLRRKSELDAHVIGRLLTFIAGFEPFDPAVLPIAGVLASVERASIVQGVPDKWIAELREIQSRLSAGEKKPKGAAATLIARIEKLCQNNFLSQLKSDGGWADQMGREIAELPECERQHWDRLLRHAATVTPEPPATDWDVSLAETGPVDEQTSERLAEARLNRTCNAVWDAQARTLIEAIGVDEFRQRVITWVERVPDSKPGSTSQFSINREVLRGLLWCLRDCPLPRSIEAIGAATEFLYKKNSPLGPTGVAILERMGSHAALARLTVMGGRVKFDTQKLLVRTARVRIASRLNISADELDDTAIPDFGFTEIGRRVETLAGFKAEITLSGRSAKLSWFKPNGQPQASIPAAVKREHPDELKALQQAVKGAETTLSTAIARFEASWLGKRSWSLADWRSQYLDHPIVGTVVRRLLWQILDAGRRMGVAWYGDGFVDVDGHAVAPSDKAQIELWHPLAEIPDRVLAWRQWLREREITQPFKQAHREIYLLTDAERNTGVYSNRFASHILKQSQFRAVAKARGWAAEYLGPWDQGDRGLAKLALRPWKLSAEFWFNAASDEGADGAGGLLYVATDQVRLYRVDEGDRPMPLSDVPPLVFSEVLRGIDLFVGVCSVGNDPNWQDGGPDGRYRDYWQAYSFGELSETANTRKAALEALVPRLTIADRCNIAGRFLVVRGDLRAYKIHLGSANILMEPNDQYLCIVADRSGSSDDQPLFLPFEGDRTLSLILSKAFLLANDTTITDPTITRQIARHAG